MPDQPAPTIVDQNARTILEGLARAPLPKAGDGLTHDVCERALGQLIILARAGLAAAETNGDRNFTPEPEDEKVACDLCGRRVLNLARHKRRQHPK